MANSGCDIIKPICDPYKILEDFSMLEIVLIHHTSSASSFRSKVLQPTHNLSKTFLILIVPCKFLLFNLSA